MHPTQDRESYKFRPLNTIESDMELQQEDAISNM